MKGTYLLLMELHDDASIMVGKQGVVDFPKGCYVYVGSALNGLERRIQRHLRIDKKVHWHIDYLLPHGEVVDIFYHENSRLQECAVARMLEKRFFGVPGFGCSDCECSSHLFRATPKEISSVVRNLGMKSYLMKANS